MVHIYYKLIIGFRKNYLCFVFPARIGWICKCLLNASLKRKRVWKADIIGSHAKIAMGAKRATPIP
jgi:hypothetical protein